MAIFQDISASVGNTPLVQLQRVAKGLPARVLVKTEGRNPAGSVKCRVGVALVDDAERRGVLQRGSSRVAVVEPTSGNTGIALAFVCAARGYRLILTMPETMSIERRKLLAAYGAKLVLTPGSEGMRGAIKRAADIVAEAPDSHLILDQFANPANPEIHFQTTGPEIWSDTDGKVDIFVAGVGTGGTITGVSRCLKGRNPAVQAVAVEPAASPVLTAIRGGQPPVPAPHAIQGIGAGFKPDTLDLDVVDAVETVEDDVAMQWARRLFRDEGISSGISGGAAVAAGCRLAARSENAGKTIVVLLPDAGDRYLSTAMLDGV